MKYMHLIEVPDVTDLRVMAPEMQEIIVQHFGGEFAAGAYVMPGTISHNDKKISYYFADVSPEAMALEISLLKIAGSAAQAGMPGVPPEFATFADWELYASQGSRKEIVKDAEGNIVYDDVPILDEQGEPTGEVQQVVRREVRVYKPVPQSMVDYLEDIVEVDYETGDEISRTRPAAVIGEALHRHAGVEPWVVEE